ncbi:tetratricopeptide repeat protein [Tundrisphaera lichenicola]|uniref:tetratricopeptide repeat protein n=1 Tax=Tundrisphaera lichenicola TaxID=2029860 RepID=UPI003EBFF3E3
MSSRHHKLLASVASGFALPLISITVGLADVVTLTPDATTKGAAGGLVRGTVISESPTKVEVKLGNTVTTIPTNEVDSISYDGHPASLDQAQAKESANALSEAADLYKKAESEAIGKPFIAEDSAFGQVRILVEQASNDASKVAEATSALEAFSRTYRNGRHMGLALESLAKLQISREDYSGVEATLKELTNLPKGNDRAALFRIKILTRKGQLDQAISELDKVIASSPQGSAKRRDAQLNKAETLLAQKKFAEAEATVRGVIKESPPEDAATQAVAHNTLGDCLHAAGRNRDALYAFLHTDLLFSREKEEHARALSQIAILWKELGVSDRAAETLERLKQEYPRSPYANAK